MDPRINKFRTLKIISLMLAYASLSGMMFVYLNRMGSFSGDFPLIGKVAEQLGDWGLPYPRSLVALLYALVISGIAVVVAGKLMGNGKPKGIIEVRLKDSEINSTFDRYMNDLKYYGSSLLPGFRSGKKINAFIAILYFLASLLPILEGNYLIMVAMICLPFIIFGLQGIMSREKRKVDLFIKIIIVVFFTAIFGISSASIINDIRSGSFKSGTAVKVICSLPDVLKKLNIPAREDLFYDAASYLDKGDDLPYFKKGIFLEKAGDFKAAKLNYTKALLLDAGNYDAKYRLSKIFIAEGNTDKALELLKEIRTGKPDFIQVFYDEAKLLADIGKYDNAEKKINIYLSNYPENIGAYRLKALILKGLGDLKGVVDVYNKAIEADHSNALLYKERANSLLTIDRLNEAFYDIEVALKLEPKDPESYLIKGMVMTGLNDFGAAAENYKKSLEIMPDNPMASALLEATWLKTGYRNAASVGLEIEKAVSNNDGNAGLHFIYAGILSDAGSYDKALQEIDKAVLLDKSRFEFYSLKCEIMLKKGKSDSVGKLIETASTLNAEDDYFNYVKGRYFLSINNYSSALQAFNKAIERNPYFVRAYAGKAAVLSMTDDLEKADESLYTALEMDPDNYYSLYAKAAISYAQKRPQSALTLLNKALEAGGQDASLIDLKQRIENAVN